jgi:hypothetical protein
MNPEPTSILLGFPGARYHPEWELITWHPSGVLDDQLLDDIVDFAEIQERVPKARPFNRYTDLGGLTHIRLAVGHVLKVAKRRRARREGHPPVRSAIFADKIVSFGTARMYETLMEGSVIEVRAFRERAAAAEWLGTPVAVLSPPL